MTKQDDKEPRWDMSVHNTNTYEVMTSKPEDIVKELRAVNRVEIKRDGFFTETKEYPEPLNQKAADLIESQQREIERLRLKSNNAILDGAAVAMDKTSLEQEIQAYREALKFYAKKSSWFGDEFALSPIKLDQGCIAQEVLKRFERKE